MPPSRKYPGRINVSSYGVVDGHELLKIHIPGDAKAVKLAITAGIHGNETLSSLTTYNFVKSILEDPSAASNFDISLYPMINPRALAKGSRKLRTPEKVDLNRVFTRSSQEAEVQLLIRELEKYKFDGAFDLHGAPFKTQFFIIGASDDLKLGINASKRFPEHLLLESRSQTYPGFSGISTDPDRYELLSRGISKSNLEGTIKDFLHREIKIPHVYVLEYPMLRAPEQTLIEFEQLLTTFLRTFKESK